jgi:four helix bundle protein
VKDFRDLKVWQKGHALTLEVYRVTRAFPKEELYGLTSQIRRSASSVPANIAEGAARDGDAEFKRFLTIAYASASELDYHLLLARDLNYIQQPEHEALQEKVTELRRMLHKFIQTIKTRSATS